jgi:recombinational DNA repair ATPase RecF
VRIGRLRLTNYTGFASCVFELNPRFNLFVGDNATGKTSVLDPLIVAMDSWFIGMKVDEMIGAIDSDEVRVATHRYEDSISFERQFPSRVEACGLVMGQKLSWNRALNKEGGRTTTAAPKC